MPSETPESAIDFCLECAPRITEFQRHKYEAARAELAALRSEVESLREERRDSLSKWHNVAEQERELAALREQLKQARNAALDEAKAAARKIWDHYEFLCAANILDGGGTDEFKERKAKSEAAKEIETAILALKGS